MENKKIEIQQSIEKESEKNNFKRLQHMLQAQR